MPLSELLQTSVTNIGLESPTVASTTLILLCSEKKQQQQQYPRLLLFLEALAGNYVYVMRI